MTVKPSEHILVCVTSQEACRRLICVGVEMSKKDRLPLKVLCVMRPGTLSGEAARTLQVLYNISSQYGAEMTVLFNENPALTVAVHARQNKTCRLVIGQPGADGTLFMEALRGLLPDLPMAVVAPNGDYVTLSPLPEKVTVNDSV